VRQYYKRGKLCIVAVLATAATLLLGADARALQLDPGAPRRGGAAARMSYFYPYPTAFTYVDRRYAFDDDPLTAFTRLPYVMRLQVQHRPMRRAMVQPRTNFVLEMFKSAETI